MENQPQYLRTKQMAKLIGYSSDYLLNNRGILFIENVHYYSKEKRINWKVNVMISWVENKDISSQAKVILDLVS